MTNELESFLKSTFDLSDSEFSDTLTVDDIANWDSLKHMELVTGLERNYQVTLEMMDIVNMKSIPDIIKVLKDKNINLE